jgi:hypothetical protein
VAQFRPGVVGWSIHSEAERFRDVGFGGVVVGLRDMSDGAGKFVAGGALSKVMAAMDKSMGAEAMAEVTRSADQMVASAKSGGFKVTPEAADPIIKVLEDFIERILAMKDKLGVFDQAPSLGGHEYGVKVAHHMHSSANGEGSARVAVDSLEMVLNKSREALLRASSQYQENEESTRDIFKGLGE